MFPLPKVDHTLTRASDMERGDRCGASIWVLHESGGVWQSRNTTWMRRLSISYVVLAGKPLVGCHNVDCLHKLCSWTFT